MEWFHTDGKTAAIEKICEAANYKEGIIDISGLSEGRTAPVISLIAQKSNRQCLIITPTQVRAKRLFDDLSFFIEDNVFLIPEAEQIFLSFDAKSHSYEEEKLKAMIKMLEGKPCVVIASAPTVLRKIVPKEFFAGSFIKIAAGRDYDIDEIKLKLGAMGYERAELVEAKGQFAVRGGIIDLFPANEENPIRIEFFDTEVDSIRNFDERTQRSLGNLKGVEIYPVKEVLYDKSLADSAINKIKNAYDKQKLRLEGPQALRLDQRKERLVEAISVGINNQLLSNYVHYFYDKPAKLTDYLKEDGIIIVEDYDRTRERLSAYNKELTEDFKVIMEKGEAVAEDFDLFPKVSDLDGIYETRLAFVFTPFTNTLKGINSLKEIINIKTKPITSFSGRMDFFLEEIKRYKKNDYKILLICSNEERRHNIKNFLDRNSLSTEVYEGNNKEFQRGVISLVLGSLASGTEYIEDKIVMISDADIFNTSKTKKSRGQRKDAKPIKTFVDIQRGDFVVHENHGIGKFIGIEQLEIQGIKRDYLKIKYAGEDMLYVPVDQMDWVQKYIGGEPKLNKLSSVEWKKTKAKAQAAIEQMARELLELNASRKTLKGHSFSQDTVWQAEFEDLFPYVETEDQLRCIEEIKRDMESDVPMERLLCGDVGYGKTEVAARAIFKCIADGKQAAILVPTTILANQHYNTFKERMEQFPFKVEMLSRFRNESTQKEILKKLTQGSIDVIIGTHRLLSKDIKFKDLGLLVVDEEQRFGVQHKEAIKMLRKNVDVLTLSATPIPRTLHLSLIGARDMSLIEEPPEERYPVQTYVMEQDNQVIREAIINELERGGQTFIIYNRVKGIKRVAAEIAELVPEATVAVGHGQMEERMLENVIIDFIDNKSNVLVCTTIIETGIDMPNANTMIILDADKFGLSQLYQLRGRVGRSNRIAYAYLIYQKDKVITEIAEKRLKSIKEFTEFGSGFKLAMRDLELRGAGNLLGTEQHGHMLTIGYELYCKLVDDTVKLLEGRNLSEEQRETTIELEVNAYIPTNYIENEAIKVDFYKKIAAIQTKEDQQEIVDELLDRFGDIPKTVEALISVALIKAGAQTLGIEKVSEKSGNVTFKFYEMNEVAGKIMVSIAKKYGLRVFVKATHNPFIRYALKDKKRMIFEIEKLIEEMKLELETKISDSTEKR